MELLRSLFDSLPNALLLADANGAIRLVNAQLERCTGWTRAELAGAPVETLVPLPQRRRHAAHVASYLAAPGARSFDLRRGLHAQRKDGSLFPVEIGLQPVETREGLLVVCSLLDVTERVRAEQTLREKTRELERSNRALCEFASVVSHDLKSPLRGIASLAEWIAADYRDAIDEDGRHQLELLRERTVRMHRMIEGILEYSRADLDTGRRTRVDTARVLREVVDALAPPPNVAIRIEEPLPDCFCNETQIAQLFQNLVGNAIQHLGRPTGTVRIAGRRDGERVAFCVADDGVGIAPEHHQRIFRIFQTLGRGGGKRSTGIGLAIVQKIVESNGGELRVESAPGDGTRLLFSLPAAP